MDIGDTFVDPQQRTWTLSEALGQGTWGRTFLAEAEDGEHCVLKLALTASDFPADAPLPDDVLRGCRDAAREQAALLKGAEHPFLPRLLGALTLTDGRPALMLAHYDTLAERIATGAPLSQVVVLCEQIAQHLARTGFVHGNLHPENILINERGLPVIADPVTPALARILARMESLVRARARWRPPEATGDARSGHDTWALCQVLYQAALHRDLATEVRPALDGLDKLEIATLKDRALARFKTESTNPRFRSRMADRFGAILHRGLSSQAEPSPPYRFAAATTLAERLAEVAALIDPFVEDVGRLLPPAQSVSGVHSGDEPVAFSVSVGCSAGVTHHEDVVCGLHLTNLDDDSRQSVADAQYKVERHRSGRLRFALSLPDIPPGRYRLKVAFSVRESGATPQIAAGEFEVRPPPGYVPPAPSLDSSSPIAFKSAQPTRKPPGGPRIHAPVLAVATSGVHTVHSDPGTDARTSDPGAEIIDGLFPRPIAPPTDQPLEPAIAPAAAMPHSAPSIPKPTRIAIPAMAMGSHTPATGGPALYTPTATAPSALAMPQSSLAAAASPDLDSTPLPDPMSQWFSGQDGEFGLDASGLLPGVRGDGEDLPVWNGERFGDQLRAIPGADLVISWVQRDAYTAFVAATAGCFVLLLVAMAVLKAL